jgi:hypothetical protein
MTIEFIVLGIIFITVITSVMYFGKSTGVAAILSFHVGYLIYANFPYLEKISSFGRTPIETSALETSTFVIILLVTYMIIRKGVSVVFPWTPFIKAFEIAVLSIILTGLLVMFGLSISGTLSLVKTPILISIFTSTEAFFWWLTGSIVALVLVLRR